MNINVIKEITIHNDKAYNIKHKIFIGKFEKGNVLDMNLVKEYRDALGTDHVLRDGTYFYFCETIEDIEYEEGE